jgi:hypothetical protein
MPASVPLSALSYSARVWPREYLDVERIEDFTTLYRDEGSEALPPLDLVPYGGGRFLIADGTHRWMAAKNAGLKELPAVVIGPSPGEDPVAFAYLHALSMCARVARPLRRSEKQKAISRLLIERRMLGDREIARLVGVSHTTVGAARRRLVESTSTATGAKADSSESDLVRLPPPADRALEDLVRGLVRAQEGRGLFDFALGAERQMGGRLARAFATVNKGEALVWAKRFRAWSAHAVVELERNGRV